MTIARQWFEKHIPKVTQSTVGGPLLLGSKSLRTFPRQLIDAKLTHIATKVDPYRPIRYKVRSSDNSQATDILHGYR
jgi:hypothetical protein